MQLATKRSAMGLSTQRALAPSLPRVAGIAAPIMKAPLAGMRYAPSPAVVEGPAQSSVAVNATQVDTLYEDNEAARVYRRTLFTLDDWSKYRCSNRFWKHISTLHKSRIVRVLMRNALIFTGFTALVCAYGSAFAAGQLPAWAPAIYEASLVPFTITSFALSLLLVFRTNSAYARWETGRIAVGRFLSAVKDVCRQAVSAIPPEKGSNKDLIARWCVALSRCFKANLVANQPLEEELKPWLSPEELKLLMSSSDRVYYCLMVISNTINNSNMDVSARMSIQAPILMAIDVKDACGRIVNTPVPLSYSRHIARCLTLWLLMLPFALYPLCGWGAVPSMALITFVLLGIEEIGVQIDEPFSIIAFERLCTRAEGFMRDMVGMDAAATNIIARNGAAPYFAPMMDSAREANAAEIVARAQGKVPALTPA